MKLKSLLTLTMALFIAAPLAFAEDAKTDDTTMPDREEMADAAEIDAVDSLQLEDKTRDQIKTIRQEMQTEMAKKRRAFHAEKTKFRTMMQDDSSSPRALRSQFAKVEEARSDLAKTRFGYQLQIREKLTPEQRKMVRAKMEQNRMRMHGKRKMHADRMNKSMHRKKDGMRKHKMGMKKDGMNKAMDKATEETDN